MFKNLVFIVVCLFSSICFGQSYGPYTASNLDQASEKYYQAVLDYADAAYTGYAQLDAWLVGQGLEALRVYEEELTPLEQSMAESRKVLLEDWINDTAEPPYDEAESCSYVCQNLLSIMHQELQAGNLNGYNPPAYYLPLYLEDLYDASVDCAAVMPQINQLIPGNLYYTPQDCVDYIFSLN